MSYYRQKQEQIRAKAIEWQSNLPSMSWLELLDKTSEYIALARRYGLTKEFRENGII